MTPISRVNLRENDNVADAPPLPPPSKKARKKKAPTPEPESEPESEEMDLTAVPYVDAEDDFADGEKYVKEESEIKQVMDDFTGNKGISGQTDLTPDQAVLLTQVRVLQHGYPTRPCNRPGCNKTHMDLSAFPDWFETYRLSIGRGSRKEKTEVLRGRVELKPENQQPMFGTPPSRF